MSIVGGRKMNNTNVQTLTQTPDSIFSITNAGMCQKSREFKYAANDPNRPENYVRTAIVRSAVIAALRYNERNPKNVMEYLKARYEECGFRNFQQKRINLLWDHRRVMRYLNDEKRTPIFPTSAEVDLGGRKYKVAPDFAFVSGANSDTIEVVQLRIGKPDITKKGTKNALIRDLRLYAMVKYARLGGFKKITASIYFLRKSSDSNNWIECEQSFFGGGGNVVSLTDVYDGTENDLDVQMAQNIQALASGIAPEAVCEEDCSMCKNYDLCKYLMPPMRIEKDPIIRSASNILLTPNQTQAIEYEKGIVRINAGAGAGKTMVVALRIKRLIEKGYKPEEICCITFTNAGAKEMLHRAELYAGVDLSAMTICTFNAFQNDIVKDKWKELGYAREVKVIDEVDKFAIIAKLLNQNPIYEWTGRSFLNFSASGGFQKGALRIAADVFSTIKKSGLDLTSINVQDIKNSLNLKGSDINDAALDKLIRLYDKYQDELLRKGLIEFDDQEILSFKVLDMFPNYLEEHFCFKHIIVDEFQDSSAGQIDFIKALMQMNTFQSLMVVGDDSQAIFGFRDTSPEFIIHFEDYIGEHVDDIYLLENHRSTPEIINFANALNDLNQDKVDKALIATRPHGQPVIVNGFYDKTAEYEYIVNGIKQHIAAGFKPEDIAVISYTKDELKQIADLLTRAQIPSMFAAPEPLLENSRIRAILAFARVIYDVTDTKDALIVANALSGGIVMEEDPSIIQGQIDAVIARADEINKRPTLQMKKDLFIQLIDDISFGDEAVENFKDGLSNKEFDEVMTYCFDFSDYGEGTAYRRVSEYPGVVLITAHSSKGLEYKVVYNTISKYQRKDRISRSEIEEVRRLFFVSATRARDELYITGVYACAGYTAETRVMNKYLKEAFSITGQNYSPSYATYDNAKKREGRKKV